MNSIRHGPKGGGQTKLFEGAQLREKMVTVQRMHAGGFGRTLDKIGKCLDNNAISTILSS